METVFSSDLKCGSCVRKITPHMNAITQIQNWHVDTADPRKLVTVTHSDQSDQSIVEHVQAGITAAGFTATVLTADHLNVNQSPTAAPLDGKQPFTLSNYKPLALVVLYVLGLTAYSEWLATGFEASRAMSMFMGYFFLAFAFFKLLNVSAFATAFATYDIVAKRSQLYAMAYPFIELLLGIAFLSGMFSTATNIVTATVMSIGLIGVIQAVRKKQAIQCACLGTAFNLPMSVVTIIENSVMIAMSLAMLAM